MSGRAPLTSSEATPARAHDAASEINPRTGEPRRPWTAWAALVLFLLGAGIVIGGLLLTMWTSITDFAAAALLHRLIPIEQGNQLRLLLAVGDWIIGVGIATVACIAGYHGWAGHRWARWAGVLAVALGAASFLLSEVAPWGLIPLALGAIALWLPPTRRFMVAWQARRHPAPPVPPERVPVTYGPVRRFG